MNISLQSLDDLNKTLAGNDAAIVYFSHNQCNVCKVLKPKISELIELEFPKINFYYIDTILNPEIAGQYSIFAVPTIIIYFEGKETARKSRNISMDELKELIKRPYDMIFDH